ncbi:metal ABC transporter substrate-binding protein [Buchananella hordeovulneris]|uniref:Zinc ABC transporter substrate-binding protein n=1 Tax=Buchananella hordeovulneris TaxID=52770 RepID=A0A1Q5PYZ8_9ACTO|nr:metal ABC transporter substrate-binding protein [Buchananella hordeovulneris]OKL52590.1 zinc ABC transporter substrate-binding protein [Buchananella hordeovulneris]
MRAFSRPKLAAALAAASLALVACGGTSADDGKMSGEDGTGAADKLTVFATTGYLADAVHNIAPEAEVITMVGPGGDPHTYQPSTKDIETMQKADLVAWNGLHLEAQMLDQLQSLGDKQIAVGEMLPKENLLDWPEEDEHGNPLHDPHIWNSPDNWSLVVGYLGDKLAEIDTKNAETYKKNAKDYQQQIADMKSAAEAKLSTIPAPRLLITGHDAFNYLGKTFNLEIKATDFVSSEAALSPQDLSNLAKEIAEKKVPVIFQDNLANPQAITSLKEAIQANNWKVEVSDKELFADSLGAEAGVDTYLGVFNHNVEAITTALGGK